MKNLILKIITSIFLVFSLLVFPLYVFSQEKEKSGIENNLYYRALYASLEKMEKDWKNIDDSMKGEYIQTDYLIQQILNYLV